MHKQSVILNRLFITGGSTVDKNNKVVFSTNSCEEIVMNDKYEIIHGNVVNMNDNRRNHGMCAIVRPTQLGLLVGLGENDDKEDNDKFEIYNFNNSTWI